MLALTRESDEAIIIGDVRIMVIRIAGNRVRLGIEAPPDVKILREELISRPRHDAYIGRRRQVYRRAIAVV